LYEKLARLTNETDQWNKFIDFVLIAYYITKYSAIGIILFLLIYNREAILLINETRLLMIHDRMISIVKEIPYIREEARLMI